MQGWSAFIIRAPKTRPMYWEKNNSNGHMSGFGKLESMSAIHSSLLKPLSEIYPLMKWTRQRNKPETHNLLAKPFYFKGGREGKWECCIVCHITTTIIQDVCLVFSFCRLNMHNLKPAGNKLFENGKLNKQASSIRFSCFQSFHNVHYKIFLLLCLRGNKEDKFHFPVWL